MYKKNNLTINKATLWYLTLKLSLFFMAYKTIMINYFGYNLTNLTDFYKIIIPCSILTCYIISYVDGVDKSSTLKKILFIIVFCSFSYLTRFILIWYISEDMIANFYFIFTIFPAVGFVSSSSVKLSLLPTNLYYDIHDYFYLEARTPMLSSPVDQLEIKQVEPNVLHNKTKNSLDTPDSSTGPKTPANTRPTSHEQGGVLPPLPSGPTSYGQRPVLPGIRSIICEYPLNESHNYRHADISKNWSKPDSNIIVNGRKYNGELDSKYTGNCNYSSRSGYVPKLEYTIGDKGTEAYQKSGQNWAYTKDQEANKKPLSAKQLAAHDRLKGQDTNGSVHNSYLPDNSSGGCKKKGKEN